MIKMGNMDEMSEKDKHREKYQNFGSMSCNSDSQASLIPDNASKAFDKLLNKAGDFNYYQWKLMIITGLIGFFTGFHNMSAIFLSATPDHWCQIPYFAGKNLTIDKSSLEITAPRVLGKDGLMEHSKCEYYDYDYSTSLFHSGANFTFADVSAIVDEQSKTVQTCDEWIYDDSEFKSTIVTEWNLVCGNRWLMSAVQSTFMMGILTGAVVFSAVSDKKGRRYTSLLCCWIFFFTSVIVAYVTSFKLLLLIRFIVAASSHGVYLANYVLLMEMISLKGRTVLGSLFHVSFPVGFLILTIISYCARDWRHLQLFISASTIILLSYHCLLPESPRWLLTHGREEEGLKVLRSVAKANGKDFPPDEELKPILTVIQNETSMKEHKTLGQKINSIVNMTITLVRTRNMRRRNLIVFYIWFVCSMIYYGLSFSGANINASLFHTSVLSATADIIGISAAVPLLISFGRRSILCFAFVFGGIASVIILATPPDFVSLNLTLLTVSKMAISVAFVIAFLFSAELVPTHVRNTSIGISSMWARIGSAIAPFIVDLLGNIYYAIPSTIFGFLALIAGLLSLLLPETGNKPLPESIEEIEAMPR